MSRKFIDLLCPEVDHEAHADYEEMIDYLGEYAEIIQHRRKLRGIRMIPERRHIFRT